MTIKCPKCQKSKISSNFQKMKNGKTKKMCNICRLKKRKNLSLEDKAYVNLYVVHKELHKYFRPKREKEWRKNYIQPKQYFCPVFKRQKRGCRHCNYPRKYSLEDRTILHHQNVLKQIEPNVLFKPMVHIWS